ncbi:MAG TPA: DUF1801 domain-containing protein [Rhizomicrobium sp.]|jgi:hypothetical protein|nr:DUF1801 domain-containing protein [Rhizomicrobium sp.]
MPRIANAAVAAAFKAYPAPVRKRLMDLRETIFDVAVKTQGVGALDETLKWGEPAYLTPSGSGSTIRLGWKAPDDAALYFICTTGLVDRFRELYPRGLRFAGNRALLFGAGDNIPQKALRHCIALALTHKLRGA